MLSTTPHDQIYNVAFHVNQLRAAKLREHLWPELVEKKLKQDQSHIKKSPNVQEARV